jgi:hypothetical protein
LRPTYHHNGQILLNQGRERNAIENVAKESKTELVLSAEGKTIGENQNGGVGIDIEINSIVVPIKLPKNMF